MTATASQSVVLIGNPASGRGRGASCIDAAVGALRASGIDLRVLRTESAGHAIALAEMAGREGAGQVVAVGGDGTIRDVVAGLERAEALARTSFAVIPGGTGNDLARTLGIPRSVPEAAMVAVSGAVRPLDVWKWNDTVFVNVAGIGMDAAVAGAVNRRFRSLSGTAAYVAGFLTTLPGFRPFAIRLSWPGGGWCGRTWLTAFGNGRCYGGGMYVAPAAEPDDGLLDVVVVEDVSKPVLVQQFLLVFQGAHVRHPRVRSFRVPEITVDTEPREATIDGELIDTAPAVIRRLPERLRVRVPNEGA